MNLILTLCMVAAFGLITVCLADWLGADDKEGTDDDSQDKTRTGH